MVRHGVGCRPTTAATEGEEDVAWRAPSGMGTATLRLGRASFRDTKTSFDDSCRCREGSQAHSSGSITGNVINDSTSRKYCIEIGEISNQ